MDARQREEAYQWVERTTEIPMLVLSLLILPVLLAPGLLELSPRVETSLTAMEWAIWSAFVLELSVKTYLSDNRLSYLRNHWFDVLIVALPFLRPLRVTRSARALRAFRSMRALALLARVTKTSRDILKQNGLRYVLAVGLLILIGCAVLVEHVESGANGNIDSFSDALWWATATISTVGYGDHFPITPEGRALAVLLMVAGITMFSVLTANIAVFFSRPSTDEPTVADLLQEIRVLQTKVDALSARVNEDSPAPADAMSRN